MSEESEINEQIIMTIDQMMDHPHFRFKLNSVYINAIYDRITKLEARVKILEDRPISPYPPFS